MQKGTPRDGQTPERGVVEMKSLGDDGWGTAASGQASRYWNRYRLGLVTNARDFVLVGEDTDGNPVRFETLRLADDEDEFLRRLQKPPRAFARDAGARLGEYLADLARALSHRAALAEPKDLAWTWHGYSLRTRVTVSRTSRRQAARRALPPCGEQRFTEIARGIHNSTIQQINVRNQTTGQFSPHGPAAGRKSPGTRRALFALYQEWTQDRGNKDEKRGTAEKQPDGRRDADRQLRGHVDWDGGDIGPGDRQPDRLRHPGYPYRYPFRQ